CATARQRRRGASNVRPRRGLLRDEAQGRFARESPARARAPPAPARVDFGCHPRRRPPSRAWRAVRKNHAKDLIALDFFTAPTATFRVLFVLVILSHSRRRLVHFNVTHHPAAEWTARQLIEARGREESARHLIRDWDQVYGERFSRQAKLLDIREAVIAPRSPWAGVPPPCGVLGERHLLRILSKYVDYYNWTPTHLSLAKDAPEPRSVRTP